MKFFSVLMIIVFSLIAYAPQQGVRNASDSADEAQAAFQRGEAAMKQGDYRTAWNDLTRAVELKPHNPDYLNAAGMIALLRKRDDAAVEYFERVLTINLNKLGPDHPTVDRDLNNLGHAWQAKGNYYKAINYLEKSLASNLKNFGPDHRNVARDWHSLGETWKAKGEYDKAIPYFEKALASNRKTFGSKSPYLAIDLVNLGEAWEAKGKYRKARR